MTGPKAHIVTFLSPNMLPTHQFIISYLSRTLNYPMELVVGKSYDEVFDADFSFICGLPYVLRTFPYLKESTITAFAAPVLEGDRYRRSPIYYSDVIVRNDNPARSFEDLRGQSWAYNEPESQSGYGITRYWLAKAGRINGFFSEVIEAGFHQTAIRMVFEGKVDAAAIDSQVLDIEFRQYPELQMGLRVIDSLGPSSIQPIVASANTSPILLEEARHVLTEMHKNEPARLGLQRGGIHHIAAVSDKNYDDIRQMLRVCEAANFLTLK